MTPTAILAALEKEEQLSFAPPQATWAIRARLLWQHRRRLARVVGFSLVLSLLLTFTMPKRYKSVARIMPPDQQGSSAMMLAALAGHAGGLAGLSSLAGSFLGMHSTTSLFIDLLRSGTVTGHLADRFNLQHVYRKHYRVDTIKRLARNTTVTDDKKSGVITIEVEDTDPVRARDLAQGYLDELNQLVNRTNTSTAHRERVFIEQRLHSVQADLEQAQIELSDYSSKNSTVDIREQTRAMVDASARIQAQLLIEQSGLQSLRQLYGDGNVRVRESEARLASLRAELNKMTGTSAPLAHDSSGAGDKEQLYPPLRQLPRLAVPYADLYRRVKVQETVFELLTQQYELARVQEVKDVPVVSVIDAPGIPEKKFFPPRILLALLLTFLATSAAATLVLAKEAWARVDPDDPRKLLEAEIMPVLRRHIRGLITPVDRNHA